MANRYWVGGSAAWDATAGTKWSTTSGGSGGASIPTASDDVFFDQVATYTVTVPATTNCRNLTLSAGAVTISLTTTSSVLNVNGSLDISGSSVSSPITGASNTLGIIFGAVNSPSSYTVTSGGKTIGGAMPVQLGGASGSSAYVWTFQDAFTCGGLLNFFRGNFYFQNKTITCNTFVSTSANSRSMDFGTTGSVVVTGTGTNAINITVTVSTSGNPLFVCTYSGATAMSITFNIGSSISFTAGTYALTWTPLTSGVISLSFAGFSGSWTRGTPTQNFRVDGNFTASSTMGAIGAGSGVMTLGGSSGTQVFTSSGKTLDFPIAVNNAGATAQLADALTMGATRVLTIVGGAFDGNNKTISGAAGISINTGSVSIANITTALPFTLTSGTMTLAGNCTFGSFVLTAGTINL